MRSIRFPESRRSAWVVRSSSVLAAGFGVVLVWLAGTGCDAPPRAEDFRVGATRSEVLEAFGAPSRTQSLRKVDAAIWGPIEDFWPRVPDGSRVDVWTYRVDGGDLELYFIDGSERVQGLGFAPEGAVFEADR